MLVMLAHFGNLPSLANAANFGSAAVMYDLRERPGCPRIFD